MTTRRKFLMGSVAMVAAAALPATTLPAKPIFIGIDWGCEPPRTAIAMWRTWWDAEQQIFLATGIPFEDVFICR